MVSFWNYMRSIAAKLKIKRCCFSLRINYTNEFIVMRNISCTIYNMQKRCTKWDKFIKNWSSVRIALIDIQNTLLMLTSIYVVKFPKNVFKSVFRIQCFWEHTLHKIRFKHEIRFILWSISSKKTAYLEKIFIAKVLDTSEKYQTFQTENKNN